MRTPQQQRQRQRQQPLPLSSFSFFERVNDVDTLSPDDFLDRFEKYGFLWFKGTRNSSNSGSTSTSSSSSSKENTSTKILDFIKEHSVACEKSWTVENHGNNSSSNGGSNSSGSRKTPSLSPPPRIVTPQTLCNFTGTNESFYVSTIVHRKPQQQHENDDDDDKIDDNDNDTSLTLSNSTSSSSTTTAYRCLIDMLPKFDNVFEDIYETGDPSGLWMFLGHHGVSSTNNNDDNNNNGDDDDNDKDNDNDKKKKRKRSSDNAANNENDSNNSNNNNNNETTTKKSTSKMIGRAEHVDEVTHSGTYHIQIAGTKTWWIRPHPDCSFLNEELLSLVSSSLSSSSSSDSNNHNDNCFERMKINVEEGDVFVLNTKIWYHNTELENSTPTNKLSPNNNNNDNNESSNSSSSGGEWSISIAQDFYLPVPCPKNVSKGDVVYGFVDNNDDDDDDDENDEIPDELPRSDNPNCVLVEIEMGECNDDDDDDDDEKSTSTKIALIALCDIIEGESLSIAFDDQDGGDDQLGNANEQIDPRIISKQYWTTNQIVLRGENRIPNDIPRSYKPNCELIEINDDTDTDGGGGGGGGGGDGGDGGDGIVCLALRALTDIPIGEVFCISPDDDEEYEEVEVDLGTGELL
jgi:hypothetical protein